MISEPDSNMVSSETSSSSDDSESLSQNYPKWLVELDFRRQRELAVMPVNEKVELLENTTSIGFCDRARRSKILDRNFSNESDNTTLGIHGESDQKRQNWKNKSTSSYSIIENEDSDCELDMEDFQTSLPRSSSKSSSKSSTLESFSEHLVDKSGKLSKNLKLSQMLPKCMQPNPSPPKLYIEELPINQQIEIYDKIHDNIQQIGSKQFICKFPNCEKSLVNHKWTTKERTKCHIETIHYNIKYKCSNFSKGCSYEASRKDNIPKHVKSYCKYRNLEVNSESITVAAATKIDLSLIAGSSDESSQF